MLYAWGGSYYAADGTGKKLIKNTIEALVKINDPKALDWIVRTYIKFVKSTRRAPPIVITALAAYKPQSAKPVLDAMYK